jgi:hypothetical protein
VSGLRCTVPRLEAALADGPLSTLCPHLDACPLAQAGCRLFAPGWWCDDRQMIVFPNLVRDCDDEANGDDEPDNDYA